MTSIQDTEGYYPPPESQGGWRWLKDSAQVEKLAGFDAETLERVGQWEEFHLGGDSWSIVIIRNGYLVREFYTFNVMNSTRFDIWSGTKSFTATAWGLLLEDSQQNRLPDGQYVTLDSPAYEQIPEGHPLTDSRKNEITIRHLLTMSSGIAGASLGVFGTPTSTAHGPFEHALGLSPNRHGKWVDKLVAQPGTRWDYSDPAYIHLSLAFANIMGQEISAFLEDRVINPIGIESLSWDMQGGSGFLGPHTSVHTGIFISARELARFGYLMLRNGIWEGKQLVPQWWIELSTKTSQELMPNYGYGWKVNTNHVRWRGLPEDAFILSGYRANYCAVIPSLDLVVARIGTGPIVPEGHDEFLLSSIVGAIIK